MTPTRRHGQFGRPAGPRPATAVRLVASDLGDSVRFEQNFQEKTMSSRLNPYLNFNGNARQALEFYRSVFGGTLNISTYADFGGQDSPDADKVMHGQLETNAGYTVMAADHASNMGDYHPPSGFGDQL